MGKVRERGDWGGFEREETRWRSFEREGTSMSKV